MLTYQHDEEEKVSTPATPTSKTDEIPAALHMPSHHSPIQKVLDWHSQHGNRAVQRMLTGSHTRRSPLPTKLKAGIEALSNLSMDDVTVHYGSDKPAQVGALAFAQGTDIHLAPGQEKHLPHEAWHVVQQMQGRVKPTIQVKGVSLNDETDLEREADMMGTKAQQIHQGMGVYEEITSPMSALMNNRRRNTSSFHFSEVRLNTKQTIEVNSRAMGMLKDQERIGRIGGVISKVKKVDIPMAPSQAPVQCVHEALVDKLKMSKNIRRGIRNLSNSDIKEYRLDNNLAEWVEDPWGMDGQAAFIQVQNILDQILTKADLEMRDRKDRGEKEGYNYWRKIWFSANYWRAELNRAHENEGRNIFTAAARTGQGNIPIIPRDLRRMINSLL